MNSNLTRPLWLAALVAVVGIAPTAGADSGLPPLKLRGLLDLAVASRNETFDANRFWRGDGPFDAYGVRLFVEGEAVPGLQIYTQFVFNELSTPRADGAYLLWTPVAERDIHVMAGKIPWLIGTWAPRAYSDRNPLIGFPLMYQHHTSLPFYKAYASTDALLAVAGSGQAVGGWVEPPRGQAIIDDGWWDFGVMLTGSVRPVEFAAGLSQGTPGWGTVGREENDGKSVLGRLGFTPWNGVRVGVSGAYGPYLLDKTTPFLPAGKNGDDYHQTLAMADGEWLFGHTELRAEGFANEWQTPYTGDLEVKGGYVEGRHTLVPGLYAALRVDAMRFSDVTDSTGAARAWDRPLTRVEAGLGYRLNPASTIKAVFQRSRVERGTARDEHDLYGAQLSVRF